MNTKWRKLWVLGVVGLVFCFLPVACNKDEVPPTVTITAPDDGDTVYGYVTIMVQAVDEDSVESITLFIDDSEVATAGEAELSYEWNTTTHDDLSSHTITATSLDPAGNEGESDPITIVVSHRSEHPETPTLWGPTAGFAGKALTFWAKTTDPDGDTVSFQFDWGDGSNLEWTQFIASGDSISQTKTYDSVGTYYIKVKAKDGSDAFSEFSPEYEVVITDEVTAGSIQINSTPPGADIRLDGEETELQTPSLFEDMAAGEHTVQLRMVGYADFDTTVTVIAEQTTTVNITLESIGDFLWSFDAGDEIHSSPAIGSDGTIYIGSDDYNLYAINSTTHTADWSFPTTLAVQSHPAVTSDGKICFGSNDSYLYVLHPEGVKYWDKKTDGFIGSSPAIGSDGSIYVGSGDNKLWAFTSDGDAYWNQPTGDAVSSSPAIGTDGTVYVGSEDGYLYSFPGTGGTEKWKFPTGGKITSSPAIGADGTIYIGSQDNYVYAVNPDGSEKWKYQTGGKVHSSPVIGEDGTIYIGSDDDSLHAIDPVDGTVKWKYGATRWIRSTPAVGADGTIYFCDLNGWVYALRSDGTLRWKYETGGSILSSPAITSDGIIYVGSLDHKLYALKGDSPGLAASAWPKFSHDNRNTGRAGN